jgi:lysine-N-methylase
MKLPLLLPDVPGLRFDCRACTNCCRELVVHLTPLDREKIDRQNWSGRLEAPPYIPLKGGLVLNHAAAGGCVFLQPDGKCRIHVEFGGESKPLACQLYPFTFEPEEGGLRVGLRFDCPTAARGEGSPLSAHRGSVGRLADALAGQMPAQFAPGPGVMLVPGRPARKEEVADLVRRLDGWMAETHRPLGRRLAGLACLLDTLHGARLQRLDDARFTGLIALLAGDLAGLVDDSGDPPAATERQRGLLRQAAFAHLEHVDLAQMRASFVRAMVYRWGQLRRARSVVRGREPASAAAETLPPAGDLPGAAVDALITRYVRARIVTHSAFGRAYYGWPVLDGLGALVLAVGVIGWLARYHAARAGRGEYGFEDVIRAVGTVDRAAGRAGELGRGSARLRLAYLRRDRGLLRLLRAYPIMAGPPPA